MSLNKNLKNKHIDEIFEFFKQDNLVAVYNNGITEIECKTANLDNIKIKKIRLLLENSTIEVHFASGAYYWTIESLGDNEKLYYDVKNILTQKHKELKIANLIFTYETHEDIGLVFFSVYLGDKNNQIIFIPGVDDDDLMLYDNKYKTDILLFETDNNEVLMQFSDKEWQLIEQYIPYSMVDVPQSIKYGTIFYE